jgi:hypothetical protein
MSVCHLCGAHQPIRLSHACVRACVHFVLGCLRGCSVGSTRSSRGRPEEPRSREASRADDGIAADRPHQTTTDQTTNGLGTVAVCGMFARARARVCSCVWACACRNTTAGNVKAATNRLQTSVLCETLIKNVAALLVAKKKGRTRKCCSRASMPRADLLGLQREWSRTSEWKSCHERQMTVMTVMTVVGPAGRCVCVCVCVCVQSTCVGVERVTSAKPCMNLLGFFVVARGNGKVNHTTTSTRRARLM